MHFAPNFCHDWGPHEGREGVGVGRTVHGLSHVIHVLILSGLHIAYTICNTSLVFNIRRGTSYVETATTFQEAVKTFILSVVLTVEIFFYFYFFFTGICDGIRKNKN